jgi:hypothetical protein
VAVAGSEQALRAVSTHDREQELPCEGVLVISGVSSFRKVPAWNCLGLNVDTFGPHLDRYSGRLGRGDGRVGDRQGDLDAVRAGFQGDGIDSVRWSSAPINCW